jgi:hypothetical protein
MSDMNNTPDMPSEPSPHRVFKIGTQRVVEDASTAALDNEAVRNLLKALYPEVAHATIREYIDGDTHVVEYLPQPGRKG